MFILHLNSTLHSLGVLLLCKTTCFATGIINVVNGSTGIIGVDHVVVGYEDDVDIQGGDPEESLCVEVKVE